MVGHIVPNARGRFVECIRVRSRVQYPPGMNTLCVSIVLFLIQRCIFVLLKLYKSKLFSKGNISFCLAWKYKTDEKTGNTDLKEKFNSKFYAY